MRKLIHTKTVTPLRLANGTSLLVTDTKTTDPMSHTAQTTQLRLRNLTRFINVTKKGQASRLLTPKERILIMVDLLDGIRAAKILLKYPHIRISPATIDGWWYAYVNATRSKGRAPEAYYASKEDHDNALEVRKYLAVEYEKLTGEKLHPHVMQVNGYRVDSPKASPSSSYACGNGASNENRTAHRARNAAGIISTTVLAELEDALKEQDVLLLAQTYKLREALIESIIIGRYVPFDRDVHFKIAHLVPETDTNNYVVVEFLQPAETSCRPEHSREPAHRIPVGTIHEALIEKAFTAHRTDPLIQEQKAREEARKGLFKNSSW